LLHGDDARGYLRRAPPNAQATQQVITLVTRRTVSGIRLATGMFLVLAVVLGGLAAAGTWRSSRSGISVTRTPAAVPVNAGNLGASRRTASLPPAARGPVSALLGNRTPAYRVSGLRARNAAQRLLAKFVTGGATVTSGDAHVAFRLTGYGRSGSLVRVTPARPRASANRVDYRHRGIDEWYLNGPLGLEQGFDVSRPPLGGHGALTLSLAISSDLHPRLQRSALMLDGPHGALRYSGLMSVDRDGRALHSWLTLHGTTLAIHVDDRGARYPLRVDPFIQQAELTLGDGAANDLFAAVTISGDALVVGAPGRSVAGRSGQGAVYVFVKPNSGWAQAAPTAQLTASDGVAGDGLGGAVAISGDTIVAGAGNHAVGGNESRGAAYVFVKPASGWRNATQTAELTASDGADGDGFGESVAVAGDTIAVGPTQHQIGMNFRQGEAYVFVKPAAGWANANESTRLRASDGVAEDGLGRSVAISGDTVALGAAGHQVGVNESQGAAYLYLKPDTGWGTDGAIDDQSVELTTTDGAANDLFGSAVATTGTIVAVGAPGHQVGLTHRGAAYVFVKPLFGWPVATTQTAELTATDGATNDQLGLTLAASDDTVVVGSPLHQVGAHEGQGALYVFAKPGATWTDESQTAELTAADGAAGDLLGVSEGVSGSVAVAGSAHGLSANLHQGAAYVFGLQPTITTTAPADGTSVRQGQAIPAAYACTAPTGATITACTGTSGVGAPIDTATAGAHTFTVNAVDSDGVTAARTVTYTVVPKSTADGSRRPKPQPTRITPTITALRQATSVWREGSRLAQISAKARRRPRPPVGTTFTFTLNEPARVLLRFTHQVPGRKLRNGCLAPTRKTAHVSRCTRTIVAGTVRLTAHRGTNHVRFQGHVSRTRKLRPGRYTLTVTATDASRRSTTARPLRFKIVP
jgi:FG-GAP repeat protein